MTRGGWLAGWLVVLVVALAFRLPGLGDRPLHNDEGVNALKLRGLLEGRGYRYDPHEFHGPTLPYLSLPIALLRSGRDFSSLDEAALRVVPVLFGIGLILLLLPLARGWGRESALAAGGLLAISPAMVFYSRYYIHELLLVFFTALVLVAGWRYGQSRRIGWAVVFGAGLGLMHATKETFVFPVAALGSALAANWLWRARVQGKPAGSWPPWNWLHAVVAVVVASGVSAVLFTSFFTNASGPLDSLRSYLPWIERAGGESPHTQPWYFYFRRLFWFHYPTGPWWSEALILVLAVVGAVPAFRLKGMGREDPGLRRVVAVFTMVLCGIYTVIPYKTPWCLLGFWHGAILLAGAGVVTLLQGARSGRARVCVGMLLVLGVVHLGWQAGRSAFTYAASPLNPYVYAHTSPDLLRLVDRVEGLSRFSPQGRDMVIKVMSPQNDFWPLPWYFRRFTRVGWWSNVPAEPFAPVMVVAASLNAAFDERPVRTHLMAGYFQLRPQVFLELYVELDLWRAYVQSLPKEREEE